MAKTTINTAHASESNRAAAITTTPNNTACASESYRAVMAAKPINKAHASEIEQ